MEGLTYYQIFRITETANSSEIKSAYHRLVQEYHPDKHFTEENASYYNTAFKEIQKIFEILSDPIKRKEYDNMLAFESELKAKSFRDTKEDPKSKSSNTKEPHQTPFVKKKKESNQYFTFKISRSSLINGTIFVAIAACIFFVFYFGESRQNKEFGNSGFNSIQPFSVDTMPMPTMPIPTMPMLNSMGDYPDIDSAMQQINKVTEEKTQEESGEVKF